MTKRGNLIWVFVVEAGRAFVFTSFGIFSNVYLYLLATRWGLSPQQALAFVFWYLLLFAQTKLAATWLAENLSLFSARAVLIIGHLMLIPYLLAFIWGRRAVGWLLASAIFFGISAGFFWYGRHLWVIKKSQKGRFGESLGWADIYKTLSLLVAPLFAGLVINKGGYSWLIACSLGLVLLFAVPLVKLPRLRVHHDVALLDLLPLFVTHPRDFVVYFCLAILDRLYITVFLIYLNLVLGGETKTGGFLSLVMALAAGVNLLIGRLADRQKGEGLLLAGTLLTAFAWLLRWLALSKPIVLAVADVLDRVSGGLIGIPLGVFSFRKAVEGHSTGRALLFRETAINLGYLAGPILGLIWLKAGLAPQGLFLLAVALSLSPLVFSPRLYSAS